MLSEKVSKEQVLDSMKALNDMPLCRHCKINPKAIAPYDKRVSIPVDELTEKLIKLKSEQSGLPKECEICLSLMGFFKLSKEDQLRLLKNEYEWRKEN